MQVSKWLLLACSTAAVVAWALYKIYRFYRSGEGRDFMKRESQNPPAQAHSNQEDRDTGV